MQAGMWLGYVSFGFIADRVGRKRCLRDVPDRRGRSCPLYATARNEVLLLMRAGWCLVRHRLFQRSSARRTAEVFSDVDVPRRRAGPHLQPGPRCERGRSVHGRRAGDDVRLGAALLVTSLAFVLAAVLWLWIPETRGRALTLIGTRRPVSLAG